MKTAKILQLLSTQRIQSYLTPQEIAIWGPDEQFKAIELYKKNLNAYQSLYPALHIFEIVFRNAMHIEIGKILGQPNWVQRFNEPSNKTLIKAISKMKGLGYSLTDFSSVYQGIATPYIKSTVIEQADKASDALWDVIKRKKKRHALLSESMLEGYVVSKVSFGFWTTLLNTTYVNALHSKGLVPSVFPNAPAEFQNKTFITRVDALRNFRNDVFHHRRFDGNLYQQDSEIWELVGYICKDCKNFFHPFFGK